MAPVSDPGPREVKVTLTFMCSTQDEYHQRMRQIDRWVGELRETIGELEIDAHVSIEP